MAPFFKVGNSLRLSPIFGLMVPFSYLVRDSWCPSLIKLDMCCREVKHKVQSILKRGLGWDRSGERWGDVGGPGNVPRMGLDP